MANVDLMIVFTAVIAVTGGIGAVIFYKQLSVMRGQLAEMQAERRPWVSIEVTEHSGIAWEERGARLFVSFALKNVGKMPATNVFFEAKAILPKIGEPAIPTRAMLDYAADIRRRRAMGDVAGETYFPDQTYSTGMGMLIDRQEFIELIKNAGMPTVLPRIIACASYSINSDKTLKQTCTSYYVMLKRAGAAPGIFSGLALNQDVPADQIDIGTAYYSCTN